MNDRCEYCNAPRIEGPRPGTWSTQHEPDCVWLIEQRQIAYGEK